jgi:hypothetical protein
MYPFFKYSKIILTIALTVVSMLIAQSGNVKSITDKAVSDYEKGKYSTAIEGMERALDIMKDEQGNEYIKLLPQTLPGWTRGERSSRSFDPTGSVQGHLIEQTYNKGNGYITAAVILNASMVQDVRNLLNASAPNLGRTGYTIESISNKRALIRFYKEQKQGEITILASSTAVAAVYGKNVTLREMKQYARLFKFAEISKAK